MMNGTMTLLPRQLALTALLAAALLYVACGGGDEAATPTTIATRAADTPVPQATVNIPENGSPIVGDASVIDLNTAQPISVAYAVAEGDLQSDQPGLATGDFNDDGAADILIGARFADGPDGRQDSGVAYVIFGSPEPSSSVDLAAGQQDVTILGPGPGANLGFAAAAADLNGDGADDIALGAPFALNNQRKTGAVHIIFGRGLSADIDLAEDAGDVTISSGVGDSFFGDSLATGDVNGDGLSDLIVGATFASYTPEDGPNARGGAVYVFLGRTSWPDSLSEADADITLFGAEDFDELGDFVTSGDINDDGFDDIIATAEAADGPENARSTSAEVHVLFGGEKVKGTFEIARGEHDLAIYGANDHDTLGFSLAAGDLDGDGIDDLVMGARLANGPGSSMRRSGQVYILYGRRDLPEEIDLASPPESIGIIHGAGASDLLGISEAVADLDGDGHNELIMGAAFADAPERADAGVIYIADASAVSGLVSVTGVTLIKMVYGAVAGDRLGANVAVADVNGDGRLELIAVAEAAAGPEGSRPAAGRVYVIVP